MGRIGVNRRGKRRIPMFFGITFRLVLVVAAASLFLSYASSYIDPSKFSVPLFFGLYFIPLAVINIILFLIAAMLRSKSAWIPVIALLPSLLFAERFFKFGSGDNTASQGTKIKIETYNLGQYRLASKGISIEETKFEIERQIKEESPDIICMQEILVDSAAMTKRIYPEYRYRAFYLFYSRDGGGIGNIILSKYKILSGGVLKFKNSTNISIYADIVINNDTIRVYNNHLESYAISPTSLIKRIREKRSSSGTITSEIINMHAKVRNTVIKRSGQVSAIFDNIQKSPYPAIVCGDFNDTPMSYTYHKLSFGSKDSFKESGKGFSATYSMLWPLLRIDYIFYPETCSGISHKTRKDPYSDHYPVVAEFCLNH